MAWGSGAPPRAPQTPDGGKFRRYVQFLPRNVPEPQARGWTTDYPDADVNFSIRLAGLTKARVSRGESGARMTTRSCRTAEQPGWLSRMCDFKSDKTFIITRSDLIRVL